MSARVEAYLDQLRRELWNRGVVGRRIIQETREHLLDAVHAGLQHGISLEKAENKAFGRFGTAEEAAACFAEENRHMVNWLFFMLSKLAGVRRKDQEQVAHYHEVEPGYQRALRSSRPHRRNVGAKLNNVLKQLAGGRRDISGSPAVCEADLRARLIQLLPDFGRRKFGDGGRIESLTLLADTVSAGKREGRYLAVFGSGSKMVWTVALAADGAVSFSGTYEFS
jgi:hypothetical protein